MLRILVLGKRRLSGKSKASVSDGGFVRKRRSARVIESSSDSGSDERQVANAFDLSDSELANIDLESVAAAAQL